jgi:hypothetical protein
LSAASRARFREYEQREKQKMSNVQCPHHDGAENVECCTCPRVLSEVHALPCRCTRFDTRLGQSVMTMIVSAACKELRAQLRRFVMPSLWPPKEVACNHYAHPRVHLKDAAWCSGCGALHANWISGGNSWKGLGEHRPEYTLSINIGDPGGEKFFRPDPPPPFGVSSTEELAAAAEEAKTMLVMLCPVDNTRKRLEVARVIGRLHLAIETFWRSAARARGWIGQPWQREMEMDFKPPDKDKA